jgi:hypothetical protein
LDGYAGLLLWVARRIRNEDPNNKMICYSVEYQIICLLVIKRDKSGGR